MCKRLHFSQIRSNTVTHQVQHMKHTRQVFAALFACISLVAEGEAEKQTPYRILCVGDSITQGGRTDCEEYTYRLPLQRLLNEAGVKYDFVGSRKTGLNPDAVWPDVAKDIPFDPDHEGYYGVRTKAVVEKVMAAWNDTTPPPDAVLIHLGTNDQGNTPHNETVQKPIREFIAFLRTKNPTVVILLGHLNLNDSEGANAIRPLVEAIATEFSTPGSPVVTVHHYLGWIEKPDALGSDTFDWVHPNPQGQAKMAKAWLTALTPFLPKALGSRESCVERSF